MKFSNELYHFGRSKKDGAPGVGTGNWRRGKHWAERSSQLYDERLNEQTQKKYLDSAKIVSGESLVSTIGETSTRTKQQNRYLRWARARNKRANNTDKSKRGEFADNEVLARKNEAKFYTKALKDTFSKMRSFSDEEVPKHFYNEDFIAKAFNDVYDKEVIEPAWKRFDRAVDFARTVPDDDKGFAAFKKNKEQKTRYGYSDEPSGESIDLGLSMDRLAYAEYLLFKRDNKF